MTTCTPVSASLHGVRLGFVLWHPTPLVLKTCKLHLSPQLLSSKNHNWASVHLCTLAGIWTFGTPNNPEVVDNFLERTVLGTNKIQRPVHTNCCFAIRRTKPLSKPCVPTGKCSWSDVQRAVPAPLSSLGTRVLSSRRRNLSATADEVLFTDDYFQPGHLGHVADPNRRGQRRRRPL